MFTLIQQTNSAEKETDNSKCYKSLSICIV